MKVVTGKVAKGDGVAARRTSEVIEEIQKITGFARLRPGTLNVQLPAPHTHRADFRLPHRGRKVPDPKKEDWDFEVCRIGRPDRSTRALILRTSKNRWGNSVIEVMAEEHLREFLAIGDDPSIDVTLFDSAEEAQANCPATPQ